jgi:hypothetical protein
MDAGADGTRAEFNLLEVLMCLPTAPALPPGKKGDFGTSPIYGQLSDKPLLAFVLHMGCGILSTIAIEK